MAHVNPQDPRVKRTRSYIQKAFIELLAEKDFENITIQHIMDRAELNRATFYNHFQDKYELLELTLSGTFADILYQWLPPNEQMQGPGLLRNLMLAVCQWQVETTQYMNSRRTLSHSMEENAKKQLYTIIVSCLDPGDSRPEDQELHQDQDRQKVEMIATMISWSIYGLVLKWSRLQEVPAETYVEQALPFLMSNLRELDIL